MARSRTRGRGAPGFRVFRDGIRCYLELRWLEQSRPAEQGNIHAAVCPPDLPLPDEWDDRELNREEKVAIPGSADSPQTLIPLEKPAKSPHNSTVRRDGRAADITGLENRSNHPPHICLSLEVSTKSSKPAGSGHDVLASCLALLTQQHPDLARVLARWPSLHAAFKAAVLAIVESQG